ncbi:hypothetical protein [Actinorhabdospora filicis]|uniref:hypothetical protein n=1 Tax=Actinorhabdospora filicis TaxID=1785913 RepID=UPI0025551D6C|nr:hypothetical protein [Actinorhabdospora filicis]
MPDDKEINSLKRETDRLWREVLRMRRYDPIRRLYAAAAPFPILFFFVPTVTVERIEGGHRDFSLADVLPRGHGLALLMLVMITTILVLLIHGAATARATTGPPVTLIVLSAGMTLMLLTRPGFSSRPSSLTGMGAAAAVFALMTAGVAAAHLVTVGKDPERKRTSRKRG